MKVCGIVSEYNPFHNGHKFQIEKTKNITDSDIIVSVMSGNFTQRGEAAVIDKWNRAKAALSCGVNLVLELPVLYAVSSAEIFCFGAISLLNSLNVIDYISFGSESGNIESLQRIAEVLSRETNEYKAKLKQELDKGLPFHKSREIALSDVLNESLLREIKDPNNILGIEYLKSLINLNSKIKPVTIKRIGAGFNQERLLENYSSASGIRKALYENHDISLVKKNIPEKAFNIINDLLKSGYSFSDMDKIIPYLRYKLYTNEEGIKKIPEVIEGLDRKISKEIYDKSSFDKLIMSVKSKRYTYTRISRILTQYFIGFENYDIKTLRKAPCPYARILGADEKGRKLLRLIKNKSSIPLINKLPANPDTILNLEVKSTKAYSLINKSISPLDDYIKMPVII